MKDDNCIFCKLANGEIATNAIYEDEEFKVIHDMSPATRGHALILPKDHYRNMYDIPEEKLTKAFALARKMTKEMTDKLGADGFNIVQNNEEVAGQTVFHFHIHLIPRYKNDGQVVGWRPGNTTEGELNAIKELFS